MPGKVVGLLCQAGDKVSEGQEVFIVEAMKIRNAIHAPASGSLREILVNVGDPVSEDQVLATLEA